MSSIGAYGDSRSELSKLAPWVKERLALCLNEHETQCRRKELNSTAFQNGKLILVDVVDACLVELNPHPDYIALSYCWGQVPQLYLSAENEGRLFQPGALSSVRELIPRTIRDAMDLVALIGQRFLWVDALSIRQEDADMKHDQISQMGHVYSNALMTIMAVAGDDASHGLSVASKESTLSLDFAWHDAARFLSEKLHRTKHFGRGWTYQETVLSKRCLYLTSEFGMFLCRSYFQIYLEADRPYVSAFLRPNPIPSLLGDGSDSMIIFEIYAEAVKDYTSRNLTYPSDILEAFSGVSSALSELQGWKLVEGLPSRMLTLALLWGQSSNTPSYARRPGSFPSWSWAGWIGTATYADSALSYTHPPGSSWAGWIGSDTDTYDIPIKSNLFISMVDHYEEWRTGTLRLLDPEQPQGNYWRGKEVLKAHISKSQTIASILAHHQKWPAFSSEQFVSPKNTQVFLIFSTMVVDSLDPYSFIMTSSHRTSITHGSSSEVCGELHGNHSFEEEVQLSSGTTISTSTDTHLHASRFKLIGILVAPHKEYDQIDVHFLLVKDCGHYVERITLGHVSLSAWDAAKPQLQLVILG
ncbi:HET-domain-containing protein [Lophium mytilinum]|uniref:HET-domain-containing protein n=1 Tax=Lophium mytilinum TaxID=390894 RepID=A0A6A6Q8H2_9PEZI|nr:HET-domain-containing protein [Lophium mytilinum]